MEIWGKEKIFKELVYNLAEMNTCCGAAIYNYRGLSTRVYEL
jgi:hypothetical protein